MFVWAGFGLPQLGSGGLVSVEWLAYGWVGTDSAGLSWTGRPQLVSAGYGWGRLSWTGFGLAGLVSVWIGSAKK